MEVSTLQSTLLFSAFEGGEKRKSSEPLSHEDTKKARVIGDIPIELINEVMSTITDPTAMLGPEVKSLHGSVRF